MSFAGHRKSSKVDVVVGEADPSSFIILYYQKGRSISVKLYGGSGLGASWQVKDRGGKPVLDSGDACQNLGGPSMAMGVTPQLENCPQMLWGSW